MGKDRGDRQIENTVVLPVLLYGATAWALTRTEMRRLDAFDMGMLRNITCVGWDEIVQNDDVRASLCQLPV